MLDFNISGPLSPQVISTIIIISILAITFIIVGIRVKRLDPNKTPKGFVLICIMIVDFFNTFVQNYISGKRFKFFAPYLFTIIVFLALANTVSLFGLTPPLSNLGIALSFSVLTFLALRLAEIKYIGVVKKIDGLLGYVKPMAPIMLPINIIGDFSTPFSMGLRLFVNLMSGLVIASMVYAALHWIGGLFAGIILHAVFDIFFGLIQAFVFFMLTTVNIAMASEA
ncbi:MAG: F0F1 ATP synthase subunit A [Candidatus Izemoplasmatales bacterium]|jgi:F-type H+-transporting ATPase subunit a|nr:F0F1 ATP synthase subunit A [Candidatus Izemoplasmatales bacterium]